MLMHDPRFWQLESHRYASCVQACTRFCNSQSGKTWSVKCTALQGA